MSPDCPKDSGTPVRYRSLKSPCEQYATVKDPRGTRDPGGGAFILSANIFKVGDKINTLYVVATPKPPRIGPLLGRGIT